MVRARACAQSAARRGGGRRARTDSRSIDADLFTATRLHTATPRASAAMATPALTDSLEPAAKRARSGSGEADAGPSDAPAKYEANEASNEMTEGRNETNEEVEKDRAK